MSTATSTSDGVPLTVWTVVVVNQSGAPLGMRFWKKLLPLDPSGWRSSSSGRLPITASSGSATDS